MYDVGNGELDVESNWAEISSLLRTETSLRKIQFFLI